MATLAVPRSLTDNSNPTEAQLDQQRTALLTFFNTTLLDADNIEDGGMDYASLGMPADGQPIVFESNHFSIQYNDADDRFELENTEGDISWTHLESGVEEDFLRLRASDGLLISEGKISQTHSGNADWDMFEVLARYRKPRLQYVDDDIITVEANGDDGTTTYIQLHDRMTVCVDRTLSLAVDANGETTGDTGAAVSGRRAALARADDTWYYIYAVLVQYGDDNGGTKSILVADTTSPLVANIGTLDTRYGDGKWVYMGVIRNGFNVAGSRGKIVPFVYGPLGELRFTTAVTDGQPCGVRLASASSSSANLEYSTAFGTGAAQIPDVATRCVFGGQRSSHGFEMSYNETATGEEHARVGTQYHPSDLTTMVASLLMEVPALTGYKVIIHVATAVNDQYITLAGLADTYT